MRSALDTPLTYQLDLIDAQGWDHASTIKKAAEMGDVEIYPTEDERPIAYDTQEREYDVVGQNWQVSSEDELRDWLPDDPRVYADACETLGIKAVVERVEL